MKKTVIFLLAALAAFSMRAADRGVITLSVANMRDTGDYSAEMITQAIMGTPVHILQEGRWLQIQTPDGYKGWVLNEAVAPMSAEEYSAWNSSEKVIVTDMYGIVYSAPDVKSAPVSDIVGGNRLRYLGTKGKFFRVGFPDGREGYVLRSASAREEDWRKGLRQDAASVLATAHRFLGIPYLWAGMSPKGVDCSGFVRATLYMHDIIIPRDASQMAPRGERIHIAADFSNLLPGDLLFFGKFGVDGARDRVSHVGFYVGDGYFIHSLGYVHVSSFMPDDPLYDEADTKRLMYASRILPYINEMEGLTTTATNQFYNE